jgi:hypothetical protein
MVKLSESEARQIQETTGQNPEDMSHEELQQTMAQQGIAGQPVTAADQEAMAGAEAGEGDAAGAPAAPPPAVPAAAAAPVSPAVPAAAASPAVPAAAGGLTDDQLGELEKLGQLHTEGVLTDAEFAEAKAKVLGL